MNSLRLPIRQAVLDAIESGTDADIDPFELASLVLLVVGLSGGITGRPELRLARLVLDIAPMASIERAQTLVRVRQSLKGKTSQALNAVSAVLMSEEERTAREWMKGTGDWCLQADRPRVFRGPDKDFTRDERSLFRGQDTVKTHIERLSDDHAIVEGVGGSGKTHVVDQLIQDAWGARIVILAPALHPKYGDAVVMTPARACIDHVANAFWNGSNFWEPPRQHRSKLKADTLQKLATRLAIHSRNGRARDSVVQLVLDTVGRYCQSKEQDLSNGHVESGLPQELQAYVLSKAKELWACYVAPRESKLFVPDNAVIKLASLSGFYIDCDRLIIDEMQNVSPALSSIIRAGSHQHAVIALGDDWQRLTSEFGSPQLVPYSAKRLELNQSIRCGDAIDSVVKNVRDDMEFVGNDQFRSTLSHYEYRPGLKIFVPETPCLLVTTSLFWVLVYALRLDASKVAFKLSVETRIQAEQLAREAIDLYEGNIDLRRRPEMVGFSSWPAFVAKANPFIGVREFDAWIKVGKRTLEQVSKVLGAGTQHLDGPHYTIALVDETIGFEWSRVCVLPDLADVQSTDANVESLRRRRTYTAVTRTKHELMMPMLNV